MSHRRGTLHDDEQAVSPVIGTLLILAITIVGITGALFWGAPELEKIEHRNAKTAMLGEFNQVRRDTLVLSITDASRLPSVTMQQGTLEMVQGTRIQVTAMHDAGDADCSMHVDDWAVGAATDTITVTIEDCGTVNLDDVGTCGAPCFRVYGVTGANTVEGTILAGSTPTSANTDGAPQTFTVQVQTQGGSAADFTDGDWLFALTDAAGTSRTAQAWLFDTLALHWALEGRSQTEMRLEAGAMFSSTDGARFLEADPLISEEAYTTPDLVMSVPVYMGGANSFSGQGTPNLYLGLVSQHLRISEETTWSVRFDFEGTYADAWCNTLLLRSGNLVTTSYAQDAAYTCTTGGNDGRRSVVYSHDTPNTSFPFELIHARITTTL